MKLPIEVKRKIIAMKMFATKLRNSANNGRDETIRRVTREKIVIKGNTTIRTVDSTTSFLPLIERFACSFVILKILQGKKKQKTTKESKWTFGFDLIFFFRFSFSFLLQSNLQKYWFVFAFQRQKKREKTTKNTKKY